MKDKVKKIEEALDKHNIYAYVWDEVDEIVIEINDGDWKHEHLACDCIVNKLFPNAIIKTYVMDDGDGSDCYSARHYVSNI